MTLPDPSSAEQPPQQILKSAPRLLRNIQGLMLGMLLISFVTSIIGTFMRVIYEARWFLALKDFKTFESIARYLENSAGSTALASIFGLLITELWSRRTATTVHRPVILVGFLAAVVCIFVSEIFTIIGAWAVAQGQTEQIVDMLRVLRLIDVVGVITMLVTLVATIDLRRALQRPSWAWLMLGLVFLAMIQFTTAVEPSDLLGPLNRLMVAGIPACFGITWTIWHSNTEEFTSREGRGTWLGVILVLLGAPYLIVLLYSAEEIAVLRAMYYITIFAFNINLLALIYIGVRRLFRNQGDRAVNMLVLGGLTLLLMALLPEYVPDWTREYRGWLQRLAFLPEYGVPAMFLIVIAGFLQFINRHDPMGGPPHWAGIVCLALMCAFLVLSWYVGFQAQYDLRVHKINNAQHNLYRLRAAQGMGILYLGSLTLFAPATFRVLRTLLHRDDTSTMTTGKLVI